MTDPLQPRTETWTSRQLAPNLAVLVAPNPGPLTLDGTNTYVLETGAGQIVVDPGPLDDDHRSAIMQHAVKPSLVLLTHGHADHSESAFALADDAHCAVRAIDDAWCSGQPPLTDRSVFTVGSIKVTVVATPGHTGDSASFVVDGLGDTRYLLSGDTVLGRGTTFVGHPQGTLGDYLASLQRLADVVDAEFELLPGHGPVRDGVPEILAAYQAHRAQRLDEVKSAWLAGARSPDAVLTAVYGEPGASLRAAALASTKAQLAYLGLLAE